MEPDKVRSHTNKALLLFTVILWLLCLGLLTGGGGLFLTYTNVARTRENAKSTAAAQMTSQRSTADTQKTAIKSTAEAQATATVQAIEAFLEQTTRWHAIVSDSFETNTNGWETGKENDIYEEGTYLIRDGKYLIETRAKQGFVGWRIPWQMPSVSDFYLEVEGRMIEGADSGYYGVVFRYQDSDNFYAFQINNEKKFQLEIIYGNEWITLIHPTMTSAIKPGEPNKISVIGEGTYFYFFINDQFVRNYEDEKLARGEAGVIIGLYDPGDEAIFEFDNFELREFAGDS